MNMIMNNICKTGLLCFFALAVSCTGQNKIEEDWGTNPHVRKQVPAETRTLTFTIPDYRTDESGEIAPGLKTAWQAGDKIVVHGEYADEQVTVTLEAGDISSDRKTATKTVSGLHPYSREDCSSTLYAAYPAEAVSNLPHCMFYTGFSNTNAQIMAACNSGDTFSFRNLSSVVTFVVDGDFDYYTFTGRKDVMLSFELYQVKITDTEVNLKQYQQSPATTVTSKSVAADGSTFNYVYVPGDLDLPGGFILRFFKDGEAVKSLTDKDVIAVQSDGNLDLGDITNLLVDAADDIDPSLAKPLDSDGSANCYIVYESGMYRFKTVKGNTSEAIEGIEYADVLCETCCDAEEIEERSVISGVTYDNESASVCFQLPSTLKPGNALIAVKDADDNILWSWHIWIPETPITADTYGFGSFKMMSRNLGALVDTRDGEPADSRSFGLLYQWGRKDPFLGARALDSQEQVSFAGEAMTVAEGVIEPDASIDKPTVLINVDGAWCTGNDNMMWGDVERDATAVKSIYDPCPAGYRIPGRKRFSIFQNNGSTITGWNYDAENGVVRMGSPAATFPIGGYLSNDGTIVNGSSIVWDARNDYENGAVSYCMFISGNQSVKTGKTRAFGGSVRCEAE